MSSPGSIGRLDTSLAQPTYPSKPLSANRPSFLDNQESDTDEIEASDINQSPVSQASTLKFEYCGHIPYSQFEIQVKELCHVLWPASDEEAAEKPLVESIRQRFTDAFGPSDPFSSPLSVPTSKEFAIEHLRGGSFNRVVGVTTIEKDVPKSRMVLRVPRGTWRNPSMMSPFCNLCRCTHQ